MGDVAGITTFSQSLAVSFESFTELHQCPSDVYETTAEPNHPAEAAVAAESAAMLDPAYCQFPA